MEHANKDDDMGPKKQGIQEKTKINGTSREMVMMTNLRFKNDLKKKPNWRSEKRGTSKKRMINKSIYVGR